MTFRKSDYAAIGLVATIVVMRVAWELWKLLSISSGGVSWVVKDMSIFHLWIISATLTYACLGICLLLMFTNLNERLQFFPRRLREPPLYIILAGVFNCVSMLFLFS